MKRLVQILLVALLSFNCIAVMAGKYYLSANGNDANTGKSEKSAWRTLEKLTEKMPSFMPGDSILVERGSVFKGILKLITPGIYVGTYGNGSKPVFSGSVTLKQWNYFGNNIWAARCTECDGEPGNLFINGSPQVLGRYPNKKLLTIAGAAQHETSLSDSTLSFRDTYWNTAEVVVRSSRWTFDNLTVKHYTNKTFTFSSPASYPLLNGIGYFIQRHISTLDQHGEWYFNPTEKMLYLYLNPGQKPGQHVIEVSVRTTGLSIAGLTDMIIENITFEGYTLSGITIVNSTSIKLAGVDVSFTGKNGMDITSSKRVTVEGCRITDSNNNGVQWHNTTQSHFSENQICRTGLHPGRGESGNGTYIALYITGDLPYQEENLFRSNTIDSVGYTAIDFRTGNTTLKNNFISNFCLIKDDGAGIYTWENIRKGNTIEGNRISNGIGSGYGTTSPTQRLAHGIYIDDRSKHVILRDNVITGCSGSGIFLHNAKTISVLNNISYSNGLTISNTEKGELYIRIDTLGQFGNDLDMNLKIEGNTWLANEATHAMYVSVERKSTLRQLGTFNNNRFLANENTLAVAIMVRQNSSCMADQLTLEEWQRDTPYEKNSIVAPTNRPAYYKTVGVNKIANGTMTEDSKGWISWPDNVSIQHEEIKILDGPSIKINIPVGTTEALLYHEGISFSSGKLYRLSFTAISQGASKIEFVPLMATEPWQALSAYTCFEIGPIRKTFTYYFVAEKSNAKARVNFKSHANFWIDTVSLYEVEVN